MAHIPAVEGLVEGCSSTEHSIHVGNMAHIPVAQRLVEGAGIHEHTIHAIV